MNVIVALKLAHTHTHTATCMHRSVCTAVCGPIPPLSCAACRTKWGSTSVWMARSMASAMTGCSSQGRVKWR
eukprot:1159973-Pelagomonas_calceolata.AAC.12